MTKCHEELSFLCGKKVGFLAMEGTLEVSMGGGNERGGKGDREKE
jgi:hypothetical protein